MQLLQAFDATTVDPTQGGGNNFPIGKHLVQAISSEITPTKNNDGGMLVFQLEIIDGPSKGITGPYRLNLYNANPKAAEIAHKQLSALCHVTGVYKVENSQQLHGIPFGIEVTPQRDPEAAAKGYTEIHKVFDRNGNEPGKPASQPAQTQQPAAQQFQQPAQQQPAQQQPAATGWAQPTPEQQQPAQQPAQQQPQGWGQQQPQQTQQPAQQQPAWNQGGANAGAPGGVPWGQPK